MTVTMATREQLHREEASTITDDMTSTTATEDTPLLRSEGSSSSLGSSDIYPDGNTGGPKDEDLDVANQTVTKKRAIAIILSVYVLIFLQGIMPSYFPFRMSDPFHKDMMWFFESAYQLAYVPFS